MRGKMCCAKRRYPVGILRCKINIIPAIYQFLPAHGIQIKANVLPCDRGAPCAKINLRCDCGPCHPGHQKRSHIVVDLRGQQTVVHRIARKDVAKAGRKDRPDAVIHQRINRRFTAAAAAKIPPRHQHFGGMAVQRVVGVRLTRVIQQETAITRRCAAVT